MTSRTRCRCRVPGTKRRVRLGVRDGRGPRDEAGRARGPTVYVVEPHGTSVFADQRRPVPAGRAWVARPQPGLPDGEPRARCSRSAPDGETASLDVGALPVRLAAAGRVHGRADRRAAVPARPDPVPPAGRRRARRAVRAARRHVLRPEPDRDERRRTSASSSSPRTACSPGCGSSPTPATLGVLDADADDRRAARPRAGVQVGRGVRDRRAGHPDPGPLRPGPADPDPRDDRRSPACWAGWRWPCPRAARRPATCCSR